MKNRTELREKKFVIADDSEVFRRILRELVESQPLWSVAAEARDGQEAVELVRVYSPDVILIDIVMPGVDGIGATRRIKQIAPATRVVAFSAYHEEEFRLKGLQAGADYFLWKEELDRHRFLRIIESLSS